MTIQTQFDLELAADEAQGLERIKPMREVIAA
jgi:hypothetical protein